MRILAMTVGVLAAMGCGQRSDGDELGEPRPDGGAGVGGGGSQAAVESLLQEARRADTCAIGGLVEEPVPVPPAVTPEPVFDDVYEAYGRVAAPVRIEGIVGGASPLDIGGVVTVTARSGEVYFSDALGNPVEVDPGIPPSSYLHPASRYFPTAGETRLLLLYCGAGACFLQWQAEVLGDRVSGRDTVSGEEPLLAEVAAMCGLCPLGAC